MLLVVYTCSDWLMEVRHRRMVLAREVAAKQAHERISRVERLKETAKRKASKLSRKLSRSMGRRTPANPSSDEELQVKISTVFCLQVLLDRRRCMHAGPIS